MLGDAQAYVIFDSYCLELWRKGKRQLKPKQGQQDKCCHPINNGE